tara:strand:+ start:1423 stop:1617 length:195 start_codon:yes stop_codon:yes gene_type:complete
MMKLETISTYLDSSIRHGSPITEGFVREIKEVIDHQIQIEDNSKKVFGQIVNTLAEEKEKGLWK